MTKTRESPTHLKKNPASVELANYLTRSLAAGGHLGSVMGGLG